MFCGGFTSDEASCPNIRSCSFAVISIRSALAAHSEVNSTLRGLLRPCRLVFRNQWQLDNSGLDEREVMLKLMRQNWRPGRKSPSMTQVRFRETNHGISAELGCRHTKTTHRKLPNFWVVLSRSSLPLRFYKIGADCGIASCALSEPGRKPILNARWSFGAPGT